MNDTIKGADERTVSSIIEAAYREGFYDRRTYNDGDLTTPEEEWPSSHAKRDAEKLSASLGAAQVPSLSEKDRHEGEIAVLEAAIASNAGHLGALIDELRGMMAKALKTMTALHNVATPDEDTPDLDARIPADDFRKFVDAHAELLYSFAPHKEAAAAVSQPSQQGQGS